MKLIHACLLNDKIQYIQLIQYNQIQKGGSSFTNEYLHIYIPLTIKVPVDTHILSGERSDYTEIKSYCDKYI